MRAGIITKNLKMTLKTKNALYVAAFALACSGCTTTAQPLIDHANATYSVPQESGIIIDANPSNAADCPAGSNFSGNEDGTDGFCVEPVAVTDELTLSTEPNGDLSFDVWVNAFNGHSCGTEGIAHKTDAPNVWYFETSEYGALCKLDITIGEDSVGLSQPRDGSSNCSAYCGNRGYLSGSFPFSSLTTK